MKRKELQNIQDLLNTCIREMCVTDNKKEFDKLYENAKGYLQLIYIIIKGE